MVAGMATLLLGMQGIKRILGHHPRSRRIRMRSGPAADQAHLPCR